MSERPEGATGGPAEFSQAELIKSMMHPIQLERNQDEAELLVSDERAEELSDMAVKMAMNKLILDPRATHTHDEQHNRYVLALQMENYPKLPGFDAATMTLDYVAPAPDVAPVPVVTFNLADDNDYTEVVCIDSAAPVVSTYWTRDDRGRDRKKMSLQVQDLTPERAAQLSEILSMFQMVLDEPQAPRNTEVAHKSLEDPE
jgi:hypothetical protein